MKKIFFIAIAALLIGGVFLIKECRSEEHLQKLIYFFSPSCHRCAMTKAEVMPRIVQHFQGRVFVEYRDIGDLENYKMLFALKQQYSGDDESVFPVLYMCGKFLDGRQESNLTFESIATFVARGIGCGMPAPTAKATEADIMKYFQNLKPLAIVTAGLIDGINPCAFTVIVFFMSFLFFQGYRKRGIAVVGLAFIFAVFLTYLLLGLGFFGWLHAMRGYTTITKIISYAVGGLSIIFGILSLYDAFIFLKKGESESMVLRLPKSIKARIQAVIGNQYRVTKETTDKKRTNLFVLGCSALGVGFVVSLFESVCTGQLYLPTIVFVLKTSSEKLKAFAYLFIYNLMFIVPLLAIYCLALAGVSSQSFANVMKKHMFLVKILLAVMFIFLGATLLHADSVLPPEKTAEELKADPNFYDFGVVKEGETVKHTFVFRNDEDVTINIKSVNTSCSCTEPKVETKVVEPGKTVPIEIAFDTKGYSGLKKRHLFVHTDSKKNPLVIFEIQADVRKGQ
ncbi:MAG: DUF1573 domain-containing protein [Candidatus Omnitrophica bacterium]|nr:DUF1573 domain-containing protein [Candidatus Omnitrophota bacterium]